MNLAELYRLSLQEGASADRARNLLLQTHWFTVNAEFDPKTGEALPQAISAFLAKVAPRKQNGKKQDRLHRITEHARPSVERLLRSLNESPRREHALLPVHLVRELDANSFIKLSNRPGRNIREKLAGKPYLQAVRRYQSVNLPENRLLKSFVVRLAELLELRRDILGEAEDDLIPRILSWLRRDEARAIARWENLPPNNTLLAHRDYRRVWDSWRRLQTLDEDIARDFSSLDERQETMTRWMNFGRMYCEWAHRFAEMPVMFDYETFSIQAWIPEPLIQRTKQKLTRSNSQRTFNEPACVDLSETRPRFAVTEKTSETLTDAYLWQQWSSASETVDVPLFESDAACLHPDAVTIASPDLFFGGDATSGYCDRAARAFAARLRDTFKNDKLIWLVPDALNDFQLEIIRRNLNARFPGAAPLPRSVAALFEQVDYTRITGDRYPVIVVDTIGGTTCVTKLIARFDADLKKRLPKTKGYYWERCPPVIISEHDTGKGRLYNVVTVDGNGKWHNSAAPKRPQPLKPSHLKTDPRIKNFAFCINLSDSPVAGGMRLHTMQARAGEIPLWRDQITELSIKVMKDGRYQRFCLVSQVTPVKPIRGVSVPISVQERFALPVGLPFYEFPLFQGANANAVGFSARLDSLEFPLVIGDLVAPIELVQKLDNPTRTVDRFLAEELPAEVKTVLLKSSDAETMQKVLVQHLKTVVTGKSIYDHERFDGVTLSKETKQLLDRSLVGRNLHHLNRLLLEDAYPDELSKFVECRLKLTFEYGADEPYTLIFAARHNSFRPVYATWQHTIEEIVTDAPAPEYPTARSWKGLRRYPDSKNGGTIDLIGQLGKTNRNFTKWSNENDEEAWKKIRKSIKGWCRFLVISLWRDGRSVSAPDSPEEFRNAAKGFQSLLNKISTADEKAVSDVRFLESCMHQDAPSKCVQWITEQVEIGHGRNARGVGFALGDVSQKWQQEILLHLASNPRNFALSVFAYAVWRESQLVERFSLSELKPILEALLQCLKKLRPYKQEKKKDWWARRQLGSLDCRALGASIRIVARPRFE